MNNLRKCQEKDISRLVEIFKVAYKFNPRMQERDYFDWQFKSSPFNNEDDYTFWIIENDREIKSFIGYIPLQFRFNKDIYSGCYTANWFSLSKDASAIMLLNKLIADFDNVFIFGLTNTARQIYDLYRIPVLKEVPRWIAVIDVEKVNSLFKISDTDGFGRRIKDCSQLLSGSADGIYYCDRFSAEEEFLFEHWESINGYCRRTGNYLNWRYLDIPRHNYKMIRDNNGQFGVYRIERIMESDESIIRILEWSFKGDNAKKAMSLIMQDGMKQGAIIADFFCTSYEIGSELEHICFFKENVSDSPIPYLYRPVHFTEGLKVAIDMPPHRKKKDLNFNEWYISKGDGDIDRIKL
jgi:hypothetical protein